MRTPRPAEVRVLILGFGVALAVGQSLLAWERGAAPTEVFAPLLYIPVFAGAVFFGLVGAAVAVAISSGVYLMVLVDQSASLGTRLFTSLLANRILTFAVYGVVVAVGTRYVESRLEKLELYDHIDDDTNLFNSAFFLEDSDLEMRRSARYESIFSVAEVRFDRSAFAAGSRRASRRTLQDFASQLRRGLRTVDRPARVSDDTSERFLVVLPETGAEGSAVLRGRLETAARGFLEQRRIAADGMVSSRALTFPGDDDALVALRREVAEADARRRVIAPAAAQ